MNNFEVDGRRVIVEEAQEKGEGKERKKNANAVVQPRNASNEPTENRVNILSERKTEKEISDSYQLIKVTFCIGR